MFFTRSAFAIKDDPEATDKFNKNIDKINFYGGIITTFLAVAAIVIFTYGLYQAL